MITIHFDFTDGTEVSYEQGLKLKDNFTTCCLDFFSFDTPAKNVQVLSKTGNKITRNILLGVNSYTNKEIRKAHNIHKMLVAGSFNWK